MIEHITELPLKQVEMEMWEGKTVKETVVDFSQLLTPKHWNGDDRVTAFEYNTDDYTQQFSSYNYMDDILLNIRDLFVELTDETGAYDNYERTRHIQRFTAEEQTTFLHESFGDHYAFSYYKNRGKTESYLNVYEMRPLTMFELSNTYRKYTHDIIKQYNKRVDEVNEYLKNR